MLARCEFRHHAAVFAMDGYLRSHHARKNAMPIGDHRSAAAVDPDAAQILAKIDRERAAGQANVARALAERDALPLGMDEAEALDIIYTLMSPQVYQVLVAERGWDSDRYEGWLARTLCATLLSAAADAAD